MALKIKKILKFLKTFWIYKNIFFIIANNSSMKHYIIIFND